MIQTSKIDPNLCQKPFSVKVKEFHEKYELSPVTKMTEDITLTCKQDILASAFTARHHAEKFENYIQEDIRYLRAHLILEEVSEFLEAMAYGHTIKAFDALCDLLFVTYGTGVTFNFPMEEGFEEVFKSNMTKARKSNDAGRLRDKGTDFQPPKLKEILLCTEPSASMYSEEDLDSESEISTK